MEVEIEMAQNLGDVVTIKDFFAENGIAKGSVNGAPVKQFTSYDLVANQQITFEGEFLCCSTAGTSYPAYVSFEAPKIIISTITSQYGINIWNNGKNSVTLKNASVNFDNAGYILDGDTDYQGPIAFTGTSSINVTSNTNGKTLIKASTLTGTITLDVDEDVEDGTTFNIEATNNNLIIENAEGYEVTSESVGNVTTYTVSIVSTTKEVKELEVGGVVYQIKDEVARNTKQDIIDDLDSIRAGAGLGATALQSITSANVTDALGYTPYNSTNPAGYTSNVGTVTSVNNVQPVNGNVTLSIPTVNNATLTIQKNGTTVKTFTANASSNVTCNITVPTDTNDLTNGAGFITGITSSMVTTALGFTPYNATNPAGYLTIDTLPIYDGSSR